MYRGKRVFLFVVIAFSLGIGFYWSVNGQAVERLHEKKHDEVVIENIKTKEAGEDQMQEDKKAIEAAYHDMYRYEIARDGDNLAKILSDQYVLVHMTGLEQSKEEYLECVRNGQLHYFSEETDHVSVEIQGDTAVLTGQSRVSAAVFGGSRRTWPLQLVISMEKKNGVWLMSRAQASTY